MKLITLWIKYENGNPVDESFPYDVEVSGSGYVSKSDPVAHVDITNSVKDKVKEPTVTPEPTKAPTETPTVSPEPTETPVPTETPMPTATITETPGNLDLIQWSMKQGMKRLLQESREQGGPEDLVRGAYELFEGIVEEENLYANYSRQELKLILRYHSRAILGLLQDWTLEDTRNLDTIVHEVYLLMMGKITPGNG